MTTAGNEVALAGSARGCLSTGMAIEAREVREDTGALHTLHEGLRAAIAPRDAVEELLLELLVADVWRLRRVLASEASEITKNVVEAVRSSVSMRKHLKEAAERSPTKTLKRALQAVHDDGDPDFGSVVSPSDLQRQRTLLKELRSLKMQDVPANASCLRWAENRPQSSGPSSAYEYLSSLPNNIRGLVRKQVIACERARFDELRMAYYRQRMRQMSIAEHAVPSDRIQKRERELRRSIMSVLKELRSRRQQ